MRNAIWAVTFVALTAICVVLAAQRREAKAVDASVSEGVLQWV